MNDEQIIDLYFERSESALNETMKAHGTFCRSIAYNILGSSEDAEECVSDTLLRAWNAIPPERPANPGAYLVRVTRNLCLNRIEEKKQGKRNAETVSLSEELAECRREVVSILETNHISNLGNRMLLLTVYDRQAIPNSVIN